MVKDMEKNNKSSRRPSDEQSDALDELKGENRVEWEKKQKHKHRNKDVNVSVDPIDDEVDLEKIQKQSKKSDLSRKKKQHLIYDEDNDEVIAKRRRRRQSDDWDDE